MARKGVFPIVATLAVVGVVLAVFYQTVMRDSNISTNTMTTEQAYADLSGKMKRIGVQEVSLTPPTIEIVGFPGGGGKAYHHAAYKAASYAVSHHPLRV